MKYHNIKYFLSFLIGATILLPSCLDDPLRQYDESSEYYEEGEAPFLTFEVNVPTLGTRSEGKGIDGLHEALDGEDWDSYIDPQKFRVLFFTGTADPDDKDHPDPIIEGSNGNKYLFEVDRKYIEIVSINSNLSEGNKGYRITIPERVIFNQIAEPGMTDVYGDLVDSPRLNQCIEKAILGVKNETTNEYEGNGFKVVVLANFPNFVEGQRQYDPFTGDPIMGNESVSTEDLHFTFGDDLSEMSQCIYDNVYGDREHTDKDDNHANYAYKHLPYDDPTDNDFKLGGRMGVYSVWVKNYFQNFEEVGEFLRDPIGNSGDTFTDHNGHNIKFTYDAIGDDEKGYTFSPYSYYRSFDHSYEKENSYTFENVWRVWNFKKGDLMDVKDDYDTENENVKEYWYLRNRELMIKYLPYVENEDSQISAFNYDDLDVKDPSKLRYNGKVLKLATTLTGSATQADQTSLDQGIHLRVYGEGTLRIKATASGSGKLLVTGKTNGKRQFEPIRHLDENGVESPYFSIAPGINENRYWEYIVEPNSYPYLDVYIQAHAGTINIHQIEYIRDRHLYDTGRVGIMPSAETPIPMYGCQEFDPIGKYVDIMKKETQNGVFNTSDPNANSSFLSPTDPVNDYKYKRVYLLRSLAKVEVLFKKSVFKNHKPTHLYMRTFNRSARCEPKDVLTPTEVLWYGSGYFNDSYYTERYPTDIYEGIDKENQDIHDYGALRPAGEIENPDLYDIQEYYDKTAWFYGMWTEWRSKRMPNGWNWNNESINFNRFNENNLNYPRIFNSRVDRSDYCRLRYVGDETIDGETYMKYVLYMPEKNIDDTDSKGNLNATAKVAHLEMRFDGMNDNYNMDDEHIYRVYFADYSDGKMNQFKRDQFDNMEKYNIDNFLGEYCYPVIRNHVYRFKINSVNGGQIGVDFTICGAAKRSYPGQVRFE